MARWVGTALALGAGVIALGAVIVAPRVLRTARPLVRDALRRGYSLFAYARSASAEFVEDLEDLFAEVKAEHEQKTAPAPASPDQATSKPKADA